MLGIVFTTDEDASVLADLAPQFRLDDLAEGTPVRLGEVLVAVTGEGKIKATLATERLLRAHDLDTLVYVGTATTLTEEIDVGTTVGISFVLEGDRVELEAPTYPRMPLECPFEVPTTGTLVSQDHEPDDLDDQGYWERLADVQDSTGYPLAYVAAQHGTTCHIVTVAARRAGDSAATAPSQKPLAPAAPLLRKMLEAGALPSDP